MEIAYLIRAHKYPEQLVRLINRLDSPKTSFIVHVNQKVDKKTYSLMVSSLSNKSNVYFCKRHKVSWGDFSQVVATINCIKEIFDNQIKCDYVKLLSGQDYPIKTNLLIRSSLESKPNKEFIYFSKLPYKVWENGGEKNGGMDRIKYYYFSCLGRRFKLNSKRNFPQGFQPYVGSAYWCFSKNCIEYINKFISEHDSFINFFKNVNLPDEIFFQTIVLNSPFQERVIKSSLTYTDWQWNSPHPEILGKRYFSKLSESSCLFARKFDITQDPEILDLIDKNLLEEVR